MGEIAANRTGRPPLLAADEKTLHLLREFGRRGFAQAECARRLGVHRQTFCSFLQREPAAAQAFEAGKSERRELLSAGSPGRAAAPAPAAPKAGETCPTCGGRVGANDDAIVLTAAHMADARRRLEDLIDRHIAARRGKDADRADKRGTGGAEGDR